MKCPKCDGAMRSYERNGITIDQCTECRGVFLDRGELDRLIDAEAVVTAPAPPPASPPQMQQQQGWRYDNDDDDYRKRSYGSHQKKKRGFLSEIFDD